MKPGIVTLLAGVFFLIAGRLQAQATFSNIENKTTGWGSCTDCAGGTHKADIYWMAQFQTTPSVSGDSTEFFTSAKKPYADVLFWRKIGPQSWATHFTWDFWVHVDKDSTYAQALEYDFFQFANHVEYMFGSQCDYASGHWDVWNQSTKRWVQSSVPCQKLKPNVWHHIVWKYHRTSDTRMHYDSLTIDGVVHAVNMAEPSGPMPSGWTDNMGVQWQLDTAASPLSFHEWVDKVKLTIQ